MGERGDPGLTEGGEHQPHRDRDRFFGVISPRCPLPLMKFEHRDDSGCRFQERLTPAGAEWLERPEPLRRCTAGVDRNARYVRPAPPGGDDHALRLPHLARGIDGEPGRCLRDLLNRDTKAHIEQVLALEVRQIPQHVIGVRKVLVRIAAKQRPRESLSREFQSQRSAISGSAAPQCVLLIEMSLRCRG
jgi:hypothetical protein